MFVNGTYIPDGLRPGFAERNSWPFTVPCLAQLVEEGLSFDRPVTFLVGDKRFG